MNPNAFAQLNNYLDDLRSEGVIDTEQLLTIRGSAVEIADWYAIAGAAVAVVTLTGAWALAKLVRSRLRR